MMSHWSGKRVLILGAARQGAALARWLTQQGASVTLSDSRPESALSETRLALQGLNITWALGGHPLELLDQTDVVCISGGVPTNIPILEEAVRRGIPLSNDTQIFMEVVPCPTVGITGSAGKTTTTALVGEMAHAAFDPAANQTGKVRQAFVGGNIGDPLLNHVDQMQADDLAILEISSFQLEQMTISPNVAAVLNITPNHLDRHKSMDAYVAAKRRILEFQKAEDKAVLGRDDPGAWALKDSVKGQLHTFGMSHFAGPGDGTYYDDGILYLLDRGVDIPLLRRDKISLRGDHNVLNVLAAFAIGHAAGLPLDAMLHAAEAFRGMPHRLELVRELNGVRWFDDSIATTPERVIAAIESFEEPIVLMLGGRDKDLPWADLAHLVCQRVDHVVLFGEAAGKIELALHAAGAKGRAAAGRPYSVAQAAHLHQAVDLAYQAAATGDVVLLSPGGTSFDEFKDFEERGERYQAWVQALS
ncbi:MAG TPA: UDP-N-acetylmuramoyl-L-alanine--D-glutamate ligase [Anaerolineales bacterium]